jgi:hypothetical protein
MTASAPIASGSRAALHAAAGAAGLTVSSSGCWPETEADGEVTALAGFIDSQFSPLLAEAAGRALLRRPEPDAAGQVTAVVMVTALGDVSSAVRVAAAVDSGRRVPPLHFFQSVPNAVAGYLAARWQLTGPVVCVSDTRAGLDVAALLIEDADADEALVVRVDLAVSAGQRDHAAAIVVRGPSRPERPGPA